jgi:hypothetical protein
MKNIKWNMADHIAGMDIDNSWQIKKFVTPMTTIKKKNKKIS